MSLGGCTHQYLQPFPKNVREQYLVFLQDTDYGVKITAFVCLHTAGCWLKAAVKSKTLSYMSGLHSEVNCRPKTRDAVGYATQFRDLKLSRICYLDIKTTLIRLGEQEWQPLQSVGSQPTYFKVEFDHYWAATTSTLGEYKTCWILISVWHVGKGIRCLFDF